MKEQVFVIYQWAVLLLGAVCLIHLLIRTRAKEVKTIHGIPRWETSWSSFLIYIWALFTSLSAMMITAGSLTYMLFPDEGSTSTLFMAISAMLTPISMILVIAVGASLRIELPLLGKLSPNSVGMPFSVAKLSPTVLARELLYLFLATLALINLVSFCWTELLHFLNTQGFDFDLSNQAIVDAIYESESPWELIALAIGAVILAPIAEEMVFRGGFYRFFKRFGVVGASIVSAALFSMIHFHIGTSVPLFVFGLVLAYAYERSGNIAVPIALHAAFNLNTVFLLFLTYDMEM